MSTRPVARPPAQSARVRRALVVAGCGVLGVGLSACESTEQESARIGRESQAAVQTAPTRSARAHPTSAPAPRTGSIHGAPAKGSTSP